MSQETLVRMIDCIIFKLRKKKNERTKRTLKEIIKEHLKLNKCDSYNRSYLVE